MPKKFTQVVKGFKESLFRGSSLSASRKAQIYKSLHPDLQGQPVAFQRGDVSFVHFVTFKVCMNLMACI
jgi:hypothetical protein